MTRLGEGVGDERRTDEAGRDAEAILSHEVGEPPARSPPLSVTVKEVPDECHRIGCGRIAYHSSARGDVGLCECSTDVCRESCVPGRFFREVEHGRSPGHDPGRASEM